jgi:hypothetical protein
MYRRLLLIAVAATLIGAANARTLEILEGAYEAELSEVTLPGGTAGTLIFRPPCDSCDPRVHSVDSSTTYHIGAAGPALALADFLDRVEELRELPGNERSIAVGIFYSLETNRITRIRIYPAVTQ